MKKILLLLYLLVPAFAHAYTLDTYGGVNELLCPAGSAAHFYTQKIGNHWWLCTPAGHVFFKQSQFLMNRPPGPTVTAASKYGSVANWDDAITRQVSSWNFNTIDLGSDETLWPGYASNNPAVKLPYMYGILADRDAMNMNPISGMDVYTHYPADHAAHNIWADMPGSFYASGVWAPDIADFYDSAIATITAYDFAHLLEWKAILAGDSSWLLGITIGDADDLFAFSGDDTENIPARNHCEQLAWDVLAAGPNQYTGRARDMYSTGTWDGYSAYQYLYYDPVLQSKTQLQTYLQGKYATIADLNAAWGSSYTTFGTSGTDVSGETIATPNGGASYSTTLAHHPDRYSLGIFIDGQLVAGSLVHDNGGGTATPSNTIDARIWGPYVTGTITYGTGALSLTLSTTGSQTGTGRSIAQISTNGTTVTVKTLWQHGLWPGASITISGTTNYNGSYTIAAIVDSETFTFAKSGTIATETAGSYALAALPTTGDTLTATYRYNGWGAGTGLMDEANNHAWSNTDQTTISMSGLTAGMQADLNGFLQQLAGKFFSDSRTAVNNYISGVLYFGPDAISTWGAPSRPPVLKAANQYIDVMTTSYGANPFTQTGLDTIYANYGDKPILSSFYATAMEDSAYHGNAGANPDYATHTDEGSAYYSRLSSILNATTNGSHPYVGIDVWSYRDMNDVGAYRAWGRVSVLDNAYDGHEDVTGSVACSSPLGAYTCGGEAGNYTDVITQTKAANALWFGFASPAVLASGAADLIAAGLSATTKRPDYVRGGTAQLQNLSAGQSQSGVISSLIGLLHSLVQIVF